MDFAIASSDYPCTKLYEHKLTDPRNSKKTVNFFFLQTYELTSKRLRGGVCERCFTPAQEKCG